MKTPFFSIVIPVYLPYRPFLVRLVRSIKAQSYSSFECLLVDYSRTDLSSYLLDGRFKIIDCGLNSLTAQRNEGVRHAIGEYVLFCDCDDYLDPNALLVFSRIIMKESPDFIAGVHQLFQKDEPVLVEQDLNEINYSVLNHTETTRVWFREFRTENTPPTAITPNPCWGRPIRKACLLENNLAFYEPPIMGEDLIFMLELALVTNKCVLLENYCTYYARKHPGSATSRFKNGGGTFSFNIVPFCMEIRRLTSLSKICSQSCVMNYLGYFIMDHISRVRILHRHRGIGFLDGAKLIKSFLHKDPFLRSCICTPQFAKPTQRIIQFLFKMKLDWLAAFAVCAF